MKQAIILALGLLTSSSMLGLSIFNNRAMAEGGCPPGTYPANPPATNVCYPFPGSQDNTPQQPQGYWENRWGAIATDNVKNQLGGATNYRSEQAATGAALNACYSRGSGGNKDCKPFFTYSNQCVALAWGDKQYGVEARRTLEEANRDVMKGCSRTTTNCIVIYNGCSEAVWIPN